MTDNPHGMEEREFEDLTLAEAVSDLMRQPFQTLRQLAAVTSPARTPRPLRVRRPVVRMQEQREEADIAAVFTGDGLRLALFVVALVMALLGNLAVFQPRILNNRMGLLMDIPATSAALWWGLAVALVIVAMRFTRTNVFEYEDEYHYAVESGIGVRLWSLVLAVPLLVLAYIASSDNTFTPLGVSAWLMGTAALAWAFTPHGVNPIAIVMRAGQTVLALPRTHPWLAAALGAIFVLALFARINGIDQMPPEMTSDHIEKALDAQRVLRGSRDIFFANNGGREPIQMYLIATLAQVSGSPVTFNHLKAAAVIESMAGVLLMFMLGRAAIGERDRRAGVLLGVALALFVAVGYWHIAITRVSLRIMLTPLVTTLFMIFLLRFIRHNRREDAVMLGVSIGIGLYAYQALRLLPIVAVIAVAYMVLFVLRTGAQRRSALYNLIVIGLVSFAIFTPMFRFSTEFPGDFWRRAEGRLLGDDVITETREDGTIVNRSPTLVERGTAFMKNLPILGQNMLRALGMFTYRADVAWLHNAPDYPTFDPLMGGLLIIGAVSWAIWAVQKRDYAALFVLALLVLMLVPSVVALANPNENPSNTRASGAMPVAYLLAAHGFLRIVLALRQAAPRRVAMAVAVSFAGVVTLYSLNWTNGVLFGPYYDFYQNSWSPQREAGHLMRGVAQSDGGWGNVFVLAEPHFFDFRGLAMEAGLAPGEFFNGDIPLERLPARMYDGLNRQDKFHYDPNRYTVIIYSVTNEAATRQFEEWFPEGRAMIIDTRRDQPWLMNEAYATFRVPPMDAETWEAFLIASGVVTP